VRAQRLDRIDTSVEKGAVPQAVLKAGDQPIEESDCSATCQIPKKLVAVRKPRKFRQHNAHTWLIRLVLSAAAR
jgi:hypothetical protein